MIRTREEDQSPSTAEEGANAANTNEKSSFGALSSGGLY